MKNRKRIAQALIVLGSIVLFASAAFHGTLGYQGIFGSLREFKIDPFVSGGMKAIWLIVSWHWLLFGILALTASLGRSAPRKGILALCGIAVLVDAVAAFIGVGLFIGDVLLVVAAVAILAGAALFPAGEVPRA